MPIWSANFAGWMGPRSLISNNAYTIFFTVDLFVLLTTAQAMLSEINTEPYKLFIQ